MSTLLTQHATPAAGQSSVAPGAPLIRPLIPLIFVSHNFALFQLVLDKFLDFSCLTLGTYVDPGQKF